MTAMKNGLYALVALVVGVMLVGLLPGQLSNLAAPAGDLVSLQGSKETAPRSYNTTVKGAGFTPSRANSSDGNETMILYADTTTAASPANATGTKSDGSEGAAFVLGEVYNPYTDIMYYGTMAAGLIVALGVYFVSKRMLG